ncbi:hypothetical protein BDV29DRAFT_20242 [Aspergillus leporis]|uniref:Isochorismatase-like domain-containing protein n=1 Tax=Aspergillus leporis TaxID=41062 RepID=A0A5N5WS05_9EURO|nr:hypothetical protein BDV29DRAFT_20242 [Aspergillus leporis]
MIPHSTASTRDSTLIIVDAQNEYASGHLKVGHVAQSRKVIAELLSTSRLDIDYSHTTSLLNLCCDRRGRKTE